MMQNSFFRTRAHLALLAAYLIYGLNFTVAKSLIPGFIKPLALVSVRSIVAALLFWITSFFLPRESVSRRDLLYLLGCSFLGIVINQVLFMAGLNLTTPVDSSLIISINPVAAFVFTALILKEKISLVRGSGLAVGLSGILLLVLHEGTPDLGSSTFLGNLFTLGSTISWALYTVVIKRMLDKYSPVTVMKWVFFFGMITNFLLGYGEFNSISWGAFTLKAWIALAFVVIMATYAGYLLITFGLKRLSPTIVSTYSYTQPVIAALAATIIGQDSIKLIDIFSALLIFTGVFLVSRQKGNYSVN